MDENDNNISAKRDALQKLIAAGGDCSQLDREFCKICPLDSCTKRQDGSYMSCLAAAEHAYGPAMMPEEAFLKLATELLCRLEIENMLRGTDDPKE